MSDEEKPRIDLIQSYLRDHFKKPRIGVIARIIGEPREYDYRIIETEKHSEQEYFSESRLIWVSVADSYLDQVRLPVPRSWGLFALSSHECFHLSSVAPENFSRLLGRESDISVIPVKSLVVLFIDAVLSSKEMQHTLLISIESIYEELSAKEEPTLNVEEFKKIENSFQQISRTEEDGRTIVQFTVIGRGFSDSIVQVVRLEINRNRMVTYRTQLLTQSLFRNCHARRR